MKKVLFCGCKDNQVVFDFVAKIIAVMGVATEVVIYRNQFVDLEDVVLVVLDSETNQPHVTGALETFSIPYIAYQGLGDGNGDLFLLKEVSDTLDRLDH